ncbi:TRAP transporter large permease subunit [Halomonas sp. MCCC 1A17488]|uniref:TRAP transporter large permease n=1 Tax=unclassified Halomonas TaxID=2609666 RepID=UPI001F3308F1|nr:MULTISPECIES: TRAP transporter large permease subunit [unclassified Halomonas]MCE8016123.1 TRAP transporter large permease subunit [Halomonas sp. MCCC 1A17488]MCG3239456.1 TRAP transporter large permease subunit [Halomonas sp. MCCC 1A17488]
MDAIIAFSALLLLILCGLWVQFAVGAAALGYLWLMKGFAGWKALGLVSWGAANSFTLAAIPLFILMAEILLGSGLSGRLYNGIAPFMRRLPGGLLHTNIMGSGIFAAVAGGSAPTAAAMSTVALPALSARGYQKRIIAGSLAAGGTLGILIPPSITMIIYATFTETSIAKLFAAGMVPGILLAVCYSLFIAARALANPSLAPRDTTPLKLTDYLKAALDVVPFMILIGFVLGSIYAGLATPTEAGAVGVVGAMVIAASYRRLSLTLLRNAISRTLLMSGNVLFIVLISMIFAYATALSGVGEDLVSWVGEADMSPFVFLLLLMVTFAILGCFMEGLGMIAIIVPIVFPVLLAMNIDPIWFGIFVVILVELGQLTPPLGIILFVVASSDSNVKVEEVVMGVLPFFLIILAFLVLLIWYPDIALWLPSLTSGG